VTNVSHAKTHVSYRRRRGKRKPFLKKRLRLKGPDGPGEARTQRATFARKEAFGRSMESGRARVALARMTWYAILAATTRV